MFSFDPKDKTPISEQMVKQLRQQIALGLVSANDPLPSVRQVSTELGINPNTVQKAYRMMEGEGLLYSIPGKGSFITDNLNAQQEKQRQLLMHQLADDFTIAKQLGIPQSDILSLADSVYKGE